MQIILKMDGMEEIKRKLSAMPGQINKAASLALARTGNAIRDAEQKEMQTVFDRPTRWTLGAMRVSSVRNLHVTVGIIDPAKYKRAAMYLDTQITGGARRMKAFERALQANGAMPTGWLAVPGEGAKLDEFGNMSAGQIVQILAWFKSAEGRPGYKMNMTDAGRAKRRKGTKRKMGFEYVAVMPGKQRNLKQPGIYQRFTTGFGKSIKPILIFVSSARYKPLFNFERVARDTFTRVMPIEISKSINNALNNR